MRSGGRGEGVGRGGRAGGREGVRRREGGGEGTILPKNGADVVLTKKNAPARVLLHNFSDLRGIFSVHIPVAVRQTSTNTPTRNILPTPIACTIPTLDRNNRSSGRKLVNELSPNDSCW